ncbi:MAG: TauD/TfdA family dioxygenase [Myxococcota bacterium]|nr:TauD/TfdA family dioxygenase [Myxococcota bacterium]
MALELDSLSGSLGSEVRGIDLSDLGDSDFASVHDAFLKHHVLLFRDQKLSADQLVEFGSRWGKLFVHPILPHIEGHPELIEIANLGKKRTLTEVWHSDVTFAERPPLGSALYALELPPAGGDTLFTNQHLAYERLSDGMKDMLDGMRAIHSGGGLGSAAGKGDDWREHAQLHPVVRTHPETGRKALYVNPGFTVCLENMTLAESAPLLRFLFAAGQSPDLSMRHRWRLGDLVLWDNRSVQHFAVHDHGEAPRRLHRLTIEGDAPR